jgi:hypothetical protein
MSFNFEFSILNCESRCVGQSQPEERGAGKIHNAKFQISKFKIPLCLFAWG